MKKRTTALVLILLVVAGNVGCQQCLLRLRGARCRPKLSLPSLRTPRAQTQAPCNSCQQPGFAQGAPVNGQVIQGLPVESSPFVETGPMIDPNTTYVDPSYGVAPSTTYTNRPIVTGTVVNGGLVSEGAVTSIPGPESGPLPGN